MTPTRCVAHGCLDGPPVRDEQGFEQPAPRLARVGLLCQRCHARLERALAELPAVHDWLGGNIASGGRGSGGDIITGTRERPLLIKAGVFDHQSKTTAVCASWVRLVCEELGLHGPDRGDVRSTTSYLLHQLDWCAKQPWVDAFAEEIADLVRDAHDLAPWRRGRHHLPERCPNPDCEKPGLVRYDGDSDITCTECGESWAEHQYSWLTSVLVDDARRRVGPSCPDCGHSSCRELREVAEAGMRAAS